MAIYNVELQCSRGSARASNHQFDYEIEDHLVGSCTVHCMRRDDKVAAQERDGKLHLNNNSQRPNERMENAKFDRSYNMDYETQFKADEFLLSVIINYL